jgi:hypothetical protein
MNSSTSTPWLFWPFVALWKLVAAILSLTGRLIGVVLGTALLIAGVVLTLTIIGAVIGVPLVVLGFLLIVRGLF